MTNRDDEKSILVEVHIPDEGYHDVCDELIFSDFEENPKAFKCTLADDYISRTSAAEKERDSLKAKLAVAVGALKHVVDGRDRIGRYCFIHENISEIAREALKAINGGE